MKIILAGASGFIGKALINVLVSQNHTLTLLTRNPSKTQIPGLSVLEWDAIHLGPWQTCLDGADAVINLTGAGIADKRWTRARKHEILSSRVQATRVVVSAIQACKNPPKLLLNASAVGFYGPVADGDVTETHVSGEGFLAQVCREWEAEVAPLFNLSTRVVILRIGVVLASGGGALTKMVPPFRFFAGGPLGSGRQWFPWIHRDDLLSAMLFCLENAQVQGPVNGTAPEPVMMKDFCRSLGRILHRPSWAPVPAFALRLLLGEMAEMLLTGQKAVPEKLIKAGFQFRYSHADEALASIFPPRSS